MIGPGDLAMRAFDASQRGLATCNCGNEFRPEDGRETCDACHERTHPRCACGEPATCVVDIYVGGLLIERAPVCSQACAEGAVDEAHPPLIDTVVDAASLGAVIAAAPCWCGMRQCAVCDWCPSHGTLFS